MVQDNLDALLESNPRLAKLAKEHAGLAEIAALLIELRHQLRLSQKEFARRAGISKTMVSELENAANDGVTLRTLAKIAKGGSLKLSLNFAVASATEIGAVEAMLDLTAPFSFAYSQPDRRESVASALRYTTEPVQQSGLAA